MPFDIVKGKRHDGARNRYPEIGHKKKLKESLIEDWCCQVAKNCGWVVRKFKSPAFRAAPDRLFMKRGVVFFVEFKAPDRIPSKLQDGEHKEYCEKGGVPVYVCDSCEAFMEMFVPLDQASLRTDDDAWLH